MGDLMNMEPTEDEFGLAVQEFERTLKALEKAAKNLMALMDSIDKQRHQELRALSGKSQQIHEFLIQIMDESRQIGEKCFGVRCITEKEKKHACFHHPWVGTLLHPVTEFIGLRPMR